MNSPGSDSKEISDGPSSSNGMKFSFENGVSVSVVSPFLYSKKESFKKAYFIVAQQLQQQQEMEQHDTANGLVETSSTVELRK